MMGLCVSGPLNTEHCDMCRSRILSALSSSSLAAAASIAELMAAILDEDVNDACMDPCIYTHVHKHVEFSCPFSICAWISWDDIVFYKKHRRLLEQHFYELICQLQYRINPVLLTTVIKFTTSTYLIYFPLPKYHHRLSVIFPHALLYRLLCTVTD